MEIDETSVTIEYTMKEHEILNDILNLEMDAMDVIIGEGIHSLPEDCSIRVRYELLKSMRQRSLQLWSNRFEVNS
jgi:hypothetical protein